MHSKGREAIDDVPRFRGLSTAGHHCRPVSRASGDGDRRSAGSDRIKIAQSPSKKSTRPPSSNHRAATLKRGHDRLEGDRRQSRPEEKGQKITPPSRFDPPARYPRSGWRSFFTQVCHSSRLSSSRAQAATKPRAQAAGRHSRRPCLL